MSYSILQDLKECLIAQEKQRNSTKRFEWMEILLQNVVQLDPMGKFLRMTILRIKRASQEKFLRVQILQKSYAIPLNQRSPKGY